MQLIRRGLMATSIFLIGFSNTALAQPPIQPMALKIPNNAYELSQSTADLLNYVSGEAFNVSTCAHDLTVLENFAHQQHTTQFDRTDVLKNSHLIVDNLWKSRLKMREKLKDFILTSNEPMMLHFCVEKMRSAFRAIRFVEDDTLALSYAASGPETRIPVLTNSPRAQNFLLNQDPSLDPSMKPILVNDAFQIQSGDVLLSRGNAPISAAIARIGNGDDQAQFSHLSVAYVEPQGKINIMQAEIEIGSTAASYQTYATDGKVRVVVFRHPNRELARLAAKLIYDKVTKASASGENLPYDFHMDMKDHSEIFCAELVQYAFEMAATQLGLKNFKIPLFPTSIDHKNTDFTDRIGVTEKITFSPADIEVDPEFEMIGEWRDPSQMQSVHRADVIWSKFYQWMEEDNYSFAKPLGTELKSMFGWLMRRIGPHSQRVKLATQFPTNMPVSALVLVQVMQTAFISLNAELTQRDQAYFSKNLVPMSFIDLENTVEQIRAEDIVREKNHQDWEYEKNRSSYESERSYGNAYLAPEPPKPIFIDLFDRD